MSAVRIESLDSTSIGLKPGQYTVSEPSLVAKASASLSATPRPFLKWAGSKRRFLVDLIPHLPVAFSTYYEPFLGGASLFFLLAPPRAVLGDLCDPLIETYQSVRNNPSAVLRFLSPLKQTPDIYYAIRGNPGGGPYKRAAEFIYLNKTCWNGLYRVNQKGEFNVPFGRPKSDGVANPENIKACSRALASPGVSIQVRDFEATLENAGSGDLIFLDPPYVTGSGANGFRDYNKRLFSWQDQVRLAHLAAHLQSQGATVIVTNVDDPSVRKLYPTFDKHTLTAHFTISGRMDRRRLGSELLLVGRRKGKS